MIQYKNNNNNRKLFLANMKIQICIRKCNKISSASKLMMMDYFKTKNY